MLARPFACARRWSSELRHACTAFSSRQKEIESTFPSSVRLWKRSTERKPSTPSSSGLRRAAMSRYSGLRPGAGHTSKITTTMGFSFSIASMPSYPMREAWKFGARRSFGTLAPFLPAVGAMKTSLALPFVFTALLAVTGTAHAAADEENPRYRWNLADLYVDTAAWDADVNKVEGAFPGLAACRGHLGDSAARLRSCLDLQSDTTKRLLRLGVYASQLHDEDTGATLGLELSQRVQVLGTNLGEATAFVRPEILHLGKAKIDAFFTEDAKLAIYRHPLDNILRSAPHTLDT